MLTKLKLYGDLADFVGHKEFEAVINSTADPSAEFPREIYTVDRKSVENRDFIELELAQVWDLAGVKAPKRQCTRSIFPAIGTFN